MADVKAQLGMNPTIIAQDDLFPDIITTARMLFEHYCGYAIKPTAYRQYIRTWPTGYTPNTWIDGLDWKPNQFPRSLTHGDIQLWRGKTTSITDFKYYATDGTLTSISDYLSDLTGPAGRVWMTTYPAVSLTIQPVAYITFVAGQSTVPSDIRIALKMLSAHLFRNRESSTETKYCDTPMAFQAIVAKYWTGITPLGGF